MRIKKIISKKSDLKQEILIDRINVQLIKEGYIVTDTKSTSISFKDDNWQIRSKNKVFTKVDSGEFDIQIINDDVLLKYTYYISFLPELIITLIILIVSLTQNYFIMLVSLPLLIQLAIRVIILARVSEEMIIEIVSSGNISSV